MLNVKMPEHAAKTAIHQISSSITKLVASQYKHSKSSDHYKSLERTISNLREAKDAMVEALPRPEE